MIERKKLRVPDYLDHIAVAITRIEAYVQGIDRASFIENTMVHDAVVRNFEIIGEAANNIRTVDSDFVQRYPDLQINEAYQMRNALAHGYYTVNLITVWNAVQNDLPILKQQIRTLQTTLPSALDGA